MFKTVLIQMQNTMQDAANAAENIAIATFDSITVQQLLTWDETDVQMLHGFVNVYAQVKEPEKKGPLHKMLALFELEFGFLTKHRDVTAKPKVKPKKHSCRRKDGKSYPRGAKPARIKDKLQAFTEGDKEHAKTDPNL